MTEEERNIEGIFVIEIAGQKYNVQSNYGVYTKIKNGVYDKKYITLMALVQEIAAAPESTDFEKMVHAIHEGMKAADENIELEDLADKLMRHGFIQFWEWYIKYLTYFETGVEDILKQMSEDKKKKTSKKKRK